MIASLLLTPLALQLSTPPAVRTRAGAVSMSGAIPDKKVWVSFAPASAAQKGTATSGFQYGLEVAIVCDQGGALYAMSNKMPPFGQPTTFAEIGKGIITDPVTKTVFSLRDGKPQGKWCPSPPGIGPILFNLITSPTSIPTFPVRKQGGSLQALVNVNAKAQFESNYWRGVLDAQGKVDGGYY